MFNREVVNPLEVEAVLEDLEEATAVEGPNAVSHFPRDLETANNVLSMSLDFLMDNLASDPNNPIPLSVVSHKR